MSEPDNIATVLICEGFRSAGLTPPTPHMVSNSVTLRVRLVESGRFIAALPGSTLRFAGARMQIKILPVDLRTRAPPAVAISLKHRTANPIAKLFIDELRALADPSVKGSARQPRRR
jgi:DNA-binding transcriptional LysR family regulator